MFGLVDNVLQSTAPARPKPGVCLNMLLELLYATGCEVIVQTSW